MPWTRLNPAALIPQLRFVHDPVSPDDKPAAHLRDALLTGDCIPVQDEQGRTIGTAGQQ